MIWDPAPWKREIARRVDRFRRRLNQRRWSRSSLALVEQDVFIAAYAVRKLLDAQQVSDEVERVRIRCATHAPLGGVVDIMNREKIDKHYDLSTPLASSLGLRKFCNQVVHSFVFVPIVDSDRGLLGFFVTSDHAKAERLFFFEIDEFLATLIRVTDDDIVSIEARRGGVGEEMRITKKSSRCSPRS